MTNKKIVVGFDGFIDEIQKPIKSLRGIDDRGPEYFDSIREFSNFLASRVGKSCSIELDMIEKKIGGNLPNFSNALQSMGMIPICIGMLGYPRIHQIFQEGLDGCRLISFAEPGVCKALEFSDGKIMFMDRYAMEVETGCREISKVVYDNAEKIYEADLLAMLNWSELEFSDCLWGAAKEVIASTKLRDKNRYVFFDLCDCSRKSEEEIRGVIRLIENISAYRSTVLSLNENEVIQVGNAIGKVVDHEKICSILHSQYGIDQVLVHTNKKVFLWEDGEGYTRPVSPIENPVISTGAGDNFNAAYCVGLLSGTPLAGRVELAVDAVEHYMKTGIAIGRG